MAFFLKKVLNRYQSIKKKAITEAIPTITIYRFDHVHSYRRHFDGHPSASKLNYISRL